MALIEAPGQRYCEASLEALLERCEKYLSELFTYLTQEAFPPITTRPSEACGNMQCDGKFLATSRSGVDEALRGVSLALYDMSSNGKALIKFQQLFANAPLDLAIFLHSTQDNSKRVRDH